MQGPCIQRFRVKNKPHLKYCFVVILLLLLKRRMVRVLTQWTLLVNTIHNHGTGVATNLFLLNVIILHFCLVWSASGFLYWLGNCLGGNAGS